MIVALISALSYIIPKMNAADSIDRQWDDMVDVALHDPLEAVAYPEHAHLLDPRPDSGGTNNTVDAGGGAAADENGEVLMALHRTMVAEFRAWELHTLPEWAATAPPVTHGY